MNDPDIRTDNGPYDPSGQRKVDYRLLPPLAMLLVIVALVSGLVFGGIVQGDKERPSPGEIPTTLSTVLIIP